MKETDIDLGIDFDFSSSNFDEKKPTEKTQRTDDWFRERCGLFTGSAVSTLMSCGRSGGKKTWNDQSKVFDFGTGSLKYIYTKIKERETQRYIVTRPTKDMLYGTSVESFAFRRINNYLKKENLFAELVGFKTFDGFDNIGASADLVIKSKDSLKKEAIGEIKCCTAWGTVYDRIFEDVDESSGDFWQLQTEMASWGVLSGWYFVLTPPQDVSKYLYIDKIDNEEYLNELYLDWCSETELEVQKVEFSPNHINALKQRVSIAEKIIKTYFDEKQQGEVNLKEIFYRVIDEEKSTNQKTKAVERIDEFHFEKNKMPIYENPPPLPPKLSKVEDIFDDLPF